jgi:hypothetical protein
MNVVVFGDGSTFPMVLVRLIVLRVIPGQVIRPDE